MPPKKVQESPVSQLSKEDLIKLLGQSIEKPKKPRAKREITEDKKEEMLVRLAKMRETALKNRQAAVAKKQLLEKAVPKLQEQIREERIQSREHYDTPKPSHFNTDLFEKKFDSNFDKMADVLGRLDGHLSDIKEMKKQKRESKKLELEKQEQPKQAEPIKAETIQPQVETIKPSAQVVEIKKTVYPLGITSYPNYRKMNFKKSFY
tara:strand:+ start:205 stop:822 length:618 start_codon:yes stop_codon:yes gene_type:complete